LPPLANPKISSGLPITAKKITTRVTVQKTRQQLAKPNPLKSGRFDFIFAPVEGKEIPTRVIYDPP